MHATGAVGRSPPRDSCFYEQFCRTCTVLRGKELRYTNSYTETKWSSQICSAVLSTSASNLQLLYKPFLFVPGNLLFHYYRTSILALKTFLPIWHIFCHSIWHILWHFIWHSIWSDILSGISSGILSGRPAVRAELGRSQVEVQRCALSSEGPRLRSGGAHWAGKVPGWGPAVHTELGRSQVKVQRCALSWEGPRLRSSSAHWVWKLAKSLAKSWQGGSGGGS